MGAAMRVGAAVGFSVSAEVGSCVGAAVGVSVGAALILPDRKCGLGVSNRELCSAG